MNENDRISELIESRIAQPKRLTLNLALPITDREFHIGGTMFGIWDAPNASDTIQVRFNEQSADQIPMKRQKVIAAPFDKVFITVPAGLTGNMEILYGSGTVDYFRMYPNVAETTAALEAIRDELQGDLVHENYTNVTVNAAPVGTVLAANANRKGFDLQASPGNAGIIYIGFDFAVSTINCAAALVAGQSYSRNDYRGVLVGVASVAGQRLIVGEV